MTITTASIIPKSTVRLVRQLTLQNAWRADELAAFALMYFPESAEELGWTVEEVMREPGRFGCELVAASGITAADTTGFRRDWNSRTQSKNGRRFQSGVLDGKRRTYGPSSRTKTSTKGKSKA